MELTLDQALQKGVEAHKAGKVQEADQYYTAILKAQPKHPDANHNMGVLAVAVGKVQAALPFFKTALEANPNITQYWLSYIDTLIKLDRMADAKAVFDQAKSKGAKGDGFDQIEKRLSSSETKNIKDPPHDQLQLLINLYTQGQYPEVLNEATKILISFPNSVNLYNIIGAANHGLAKHKEAIEAYNKALAIKPDIAEPYFNIGNALKEQGRLDEAIEAYNKALAIKPDYAEAYYNIGFALKEQRRLDEAIEAYNKALAIKPDYAGAYNNIGVTCKEQGKLDEAIEAYNKALSIKPDFAEAYFNLGNALHAQGKLDEAIEAYNEATSVKTDYAHAYSYMGIVLKEKGKIDEAIEAYNKALSIKPDYAEAKMNLSAVKNLDVPAWHISMMNDLVRNNAYLEALKLAITDNDLVLEIGTGSGLLAMMSINAGAKAVVSCEVSKTMAAIAKEIISENGYVNKIKVLNKKSTDLLVGEDLSNKADVIVSEILSSEFVGEGVLATIVDANKRLLAKNGKMLPESGDIRIALIGDSEEIREKIYVQEINGFDYSKFNSVTGNKFPLNLKNKPNLLSKTEVAFKFDLCRLEVLTKKEKILSLKASKSGLCYGIIQWLGIQIFKKMSNMKINLEKHLHIGPLLSTASINLFMLVGDKK